MADRYFISEPPRDGRATLTAAEAHHLLHVMRAKVGAEILLFDGHGQEHAAKVVRIERDRVECEVLSSTQVDRELGWPLVMCVALPKGDRQRWLVEKLTELGATRLVPLVTQRGVAQATAGARARLERAVIEAAKQCGRARLMEIGEPRTLEQALNAAPANGRRWIADRSGRPMHELLGRERAAVESWLAIGPEGGFTDQELAAAAAAGWQAVSLGPRVLRVETAAVALAAVLAQCAAG